MSLLFADCVISQFQSDEHSYKNRRCPGEFEMYLKCNRCRVSCLDMGKPCKDKCTSGCFCRMGYLRIRPGGKCVPELMCVIGNVTEFWLR
ncbi:hypothetical protein Trydic_g14600 [Trypoxylus dichotomus]